MSPNQVNDAIARACGLPSDRLAKMSITVHADRWPVVHAIYLPDDVGNLVDVLGSLELREDLAHIELPDPPAQTPP
ncbi:MAG: hypothetical protein K2Q07_09925 [Burkholderiaceae bacterium]|nr:hypothetical protein [Burkholderiaceae bacterium]